MDKEPELEKEPRFPGDLYLVKVNKKAGIRLFINKIEVKNKAVINQFVAGAWNFGIESQDIESNEKVTFLHPDTAYIEGSSSKPFVVTRTGNQFLFRSIDKIYTTSGGFRLLGKMNKQRSELGLPRYDGQFPADYLMVGYGNYAKFEMSVYNYKLVKATPGGDYYDFDNLGAGSIGSRGEYAGKVLNEFDYTYVNSLTQADTLAVEEYTYTFMLR
ncbi:hypothetical protein [Dyadobacter sp. SG02]|uniref:hypothetical protein n=1 Tax=Dyadobacter sp. SG02 TaxID=1855291 RepID=UPI000B82C355|nr:hypothetical protein [Dyadobacter sp. SG02]